MVKNKFEYANQPDIVIIETLPFGGANGSEMYKFAEFYNILHYYLHDLSNKDQKRVSNVYIGKLIAYTYCAYFWYQGNLPFFIQFYFLVRIN